MDPITLMTTAAIAGATIIGSKLVEQSTEHVWDTFMARLRRKASGNSQAEAALATANDPQAVQQAVQATNTANDPELVALAQRVIAQLPQQQVLQMAKMIQNFQHVERLDQTFNL